MDGKGRGAEYNVVLNVDMFINHNKCPNPKCRRKGLSVAGCGAYCVVCSDKVATVAARQKDRTCHVDCHGSQGRQVNEWGWIKIDNSNGRTVKCPHCSAVVSSDFGPKLKHTVGPHSCLILSLFHPGSVCFSALLFLCSCPLTSPRIHLISLSFALSLSLSPISLSFVRSLGNLCVDAGASPQHL
jgi:hypothetical protein